MKKNPGRDIFVIGFALFSMFFGAGNVIFPPYLGMGAGSDWVLGFVCYYIADIGLALFAMFSILKGGGAEAIMNTAGKIPAIILMCAIVLCIGPMLAIPRTAAMTFEMGVQPLTDGINSIVFSIIFFVIVLLCSIRENAVVDIIGKILTPFLLLGLIVLIVKGIATPLGGFAEIPHTDNVAETGIKAGYQTMDVLATMLFGVFILRTTEGKGYTETKEKFGIALKASFVSGAVLLLIYAGLTFLGASVSTQYDLSTGRSELMLAIVKGLLGNSGTIIFSIVVALACLTTAVGLVSSCADYFAKLSKDRVPYWVFVTIICVFSAVVSNIGLEQIVSIAGPILDIVYPPTLILIAFSFIPKAPQLAARCATGAGLVFSVLAAIDAYTQFKMPFLAYLPCSSLGFGWLVPAILFALIGWFIRPKHKETAAA